jgi:hypothetical protein
MTETNTNNIAKNNFLPFGLKWKPLTLLFSSATIGSIALGIQHPLLILKY